MSRSDLEQSIQDLSSVTGTAIKVIEDFVQSVRLVHEDLKAIEKFRKSRDYVESLLSDPNAEIEFIKAGSAGLELKGKDYLELDLDGDIGYHIIKDEE